MTRLPLPRRATLLATLALLASACDTARPTPAPEPDVTTVRAPTWPGTLPLTAPYRTQLIVTDTARWALTAAPAWADVTLTRGNDTRTLSVHVPRPADLVPAAADVPSPTGAVTLTGDAGARQLTLQVQLLTLQGRVPLTPTARPAPLTIQTAARPQTPPKADTIVVRHPDGRLDTRPASDPPGGLQTAPNVTLRAQQAAAAPWTPGDELSPMQWEAPRLGLGTLLTDRTGEYGTPITVAVLDTGVMTTHPDLSGRTWPDGAMDFVGDPGNGDGDGPDPDPTDTHDLHGRTIGSHGTHVAGIIAARHDGPGPQTGIVGRTVAAPVTLLPVRVLDQNQNGTLADFLTGLRYAAGLPVTVNGRTYTNPHPAQVINASLGVPASEAYPDSIRMLCDGVTEATLAGALVVAASGNHGTVGDPMYPASCPEAVSVAGVTLDAQGAWVRAPYSNANAQVTLSAPGGFPGTSHNGQTVAGERVPDLILSTDWDRVNDRPVHAFRAGTSMAAPTVSAVAALVMSKGVARTPAAVRAHLQRTATDLGPAGPDAATGAGLVNVTAALNLTAPPPPPPATVTPGVTVTLQGAGRTYTPAVTGNDRDGYRYRAHLAPGTYVLTGGVDANADGQLQPGEVALTRNVTLTDQDLTLP